MKGTIALDIDGTITADHFHLPTRVSAFFEELYNQGWQLMFVTGRPFRWAFPTLKSLPFPYYLAVQNGAILLEMPKIQILSKKYVDRSVFVPMDHICRDEPTDYVLYCGVEHQDICYYRPHCFARDLLSLIEARVKAFGEDWRAVDSYAGVPQQGFPSIKCFGRYPSALRIAERIEKEIGLHVPVIRDPFDDQYYVIQATHQEISKGQAVRDLIAKLGTSGVIIAAGDDQNDLTMLMIADCKVVMETAPKELQAIADIVAPAASKEGIIYGLQEAIKRVGA